MSIYADDYIPVIKYHGLNVANNLRLPNDNALIKIGQTSRAVIVTGLTLINLGNNPIAQLNPSQLFGGIIVQRSLNGAGSLTFPSGAEISAYIPNVNFGDSFRVKYANVGTLHSITLNTYDGVTVVGNPVVPALNNRDLLFVMVDYDTWNCYV